MLDQLTPVIVAAYIEELGQHLDKRSVKQHEVPAHHNAEAYEDAHLGAAGNPDDRKGPLFRSLNRERHLTARRLHRLRGTGDDKAAFTADRTADR